MDPRARLIATALLLALTAGSARAVKPEEVTIELYVMGLRLKDTNPTDHPSTHSTSEFRRKYTRYFKKIELAGPDKNDIFEVLYQRFGKRAATTSNTFRFYRRLREADVRGWMQEAVAAGGGSALKVVLNPFDRRRTLKASEDIEVPDLIGNAWITIEVRDGDSFRKIAARRLDLALAAGMKLPATTTRGQALDALERSILARNHLRFGAWPAAAPVSLGGPKQRVVVLGEYGSRHLGTRRVFSEGLQRFTLVHEAAHIGDTGRCSDRGYAYGPDGHHGLQEITTPHEAFSEAWGHCFGVNVWPEFAELVEGVDARPLFVEDPKQPRRKLGIRPQDLTVWDMAANEAYVTRLLQALLSLQGLDLEKLGTAFRAIQGEDCATVGQLLVALSTRNPAVDLEPALAVAFANRDRGNYTRLLRGEVGPGNQRNTNPRLQAAPPSPVAPTSPAPAELAQGSAEGLMGF